jgi:dihydrofolate synthase / folylpolyglutamate synthase
MPDIKTFAELEEVVASLKPSTADRRIQSPEHMMQLMDFLGNPQDGYAVIHVAGTSGKTSTAYYVAALLQAAGKKVGLTVSPHVDTISERAQIDLQPLPEAEFCKEFCEFLRLVTLSGVTPTYFEAFTAFAFWEFARQDVAYAVIEVGVGGLADSTNVMHRPGKVCIISDIGYDHMNVLGHTLAEIAAQKAGIIQLHNAVFCHVQSEEVMLPIRTRSQQKQADLHEVYEEAKGFDFLPLFQRRNFTLSRAAVQYLLKRDEHVTLTQDMIMYAAQVVIPARMEIRQHTGKTVILDGAHNTQKMQGLVRSLQAQFPGKSTAVLLALSRPGSKFAARMVHALMPLKPYVIVTGFLPDATGHYASANPEKIVDAVRDELGSGEMITNPVDAFAALLGRSEDILVVTGSFYLLNHIRPLL